MPRFATQESRVRTCADGTRVFVSPLELGPLPANANVALERGAHAHPSRPFLVARDARDAWETLSYAEALRRAQRVASGLLAAGVTPDRPVLILAPNGIAHATLALAAAYVGIPVAPLPLEYVRIGADPARLARLIATIGPSLAFLENAHLTPEAVPTFDGIEIVDDIATLERDVTSDVAEHAARVTLDSIAKIVFTSGSTGDAKGVINTHRMIVANQVAFEQVWFSNAAEEREKPESPVLVDWLPWSHTYGGNKVFHFALHRGGTLYIDDGRPTSDGFARTLRNLREIAPTVYFGVPRSFALLVPELATDRALRDRFFTRLGFAFSAGAAMPLPLAAAFAEVARTATARIVPLLGGWGATETAPGATCVHELAPRQNSLGVPLPGVEVALAPIDQGYELRVRGPNVTPGYWRRPDASATAFDASGFYRSGDAGSLVDEAVPGAGFAFGGRLTEHFKTSSGAWVVASTLRERFLEAAAPLASDAVITGADRDDVGVLVYLDIAAARARAGTPTAELPELAADPAIRSEVSSALSAIAAGATAQTERIARAAIVGDPPQAATGELTAKGTIARGVALRLRAGAIAALHDGPAGLCDTTGSARLAGEP